MFLKKIKKAYLTVFLLTLLIIPNYAYAYSDYILAGGENIGIELNASGVLVVGMYQVNGLYPAKEAGLQVGDTITKVNGEQVSDITSLVAAINRITSNNVKLTYIRNSTTKQTTLQLYKDENNVYKTGLYVKDSITGIGTLSFIDPNTKIFGALGHEITEKSTGKILEIKDGTIFDSTVVSINKSENGSPGEKTARYYVNEVNGSVVENTAQGIFGTYTEEIPDKKLYKVAQPDEIQTGSASILTVLNGTEIGTYDINILKISNGTNQKTKNILFEIVDEELLEITGGIVQGMSGSPIIQGDYIIGAITHVVINEPTKGYGIFITNMLEEAEN
ncbi:MAG: SpoIVB peptidase [Bacilli bacterium]|nr:SpoIVB peptidase [Bacilli bacterium]